MELILQRKKRRIKIGLAIGHNFVCIYYTYSPPMVDFIAEHDNLRAIVRISLLPVAGMSLVALKIGPVSTIALMLIFMICFVGLIWFRQKYKE